MPAATRHTTPLDRQSATGRHRRVYIITLSNIHRFSKFFPSHVILENLQQSNHYFKPVRIRLLPAPECNCSPPHPTSVSALPAKKNRTSEICVEVNKTVSKFHLSGSVAPNSPDLSPFAYNVCGVMQQRVYRTLFGNVDELEKRLVEVWSRTLSTLLSMNGENVCVPVFTQRADISNIFCKQLDNWSVG